MKRTAGPANGGAAKAKLADVARAAGVSTCVVSAVLNGRRSTVRYSPETERKVAAAARRLRYRKDPVSAALRTGRRMVVGIYRGDPARLLTHPYGALQVACYQRALARRGYSALLAPLDINPDLDMRVMDGLILAGRSEGDEAAVARAARTVPTLGHHGISLKCILPDPAPVFAAIERSHELAARYLLGLGHRDIVIFDLKWSACPAEELFQRESRAAGVEVRTRMDRGKWFERSYPGLDSFLQAERQPTAYYVFDDDVAQHVIDRLSRRGVSVPGDVSVLSRETHDLEAFAAKGISGVDPQWSVYWESMTNQFLDVIEGARAPGDIRPDMAAPRLIVRASSGPARGGGLL